MLWRDSLISFMSDKNHPGWGVSHSKRVYRRAVRIATDSSLKIDDDVVFAVAYIHDIGALEPYRDPSIDHAVRSAALLDELLPRMGFPEDKLSKVRDCVLRHMYTSEPSEFNEGIVIRDSDALDFLGAIGVTRILSLMGRHVWAPNPKGAIERIMLFHGEIPDRLVTESAKEMVNGRLSETEAFFAALERETEGFDEL